MIGIRGPESPFLPSKSLGYISSNTHDTLHLHRYLASDRGGVPVSGHRAGRFSPGYKMLSYPVHDPARQAQILDVLHPTPVARPCLTSTYYAAHRSSLDTLLGGGRDPSVHRRLRSRMEGESRYESTDRASTSLSNRPAFDPAEDHSLSSIPGLSRISTFFARPYDLSPPHQRVGDNARTGDVMQ
jgi:hypothetical protein